MTFDTFGGRLSAILRIAVWFGLVAGLTEGILFLIVQQTGARVGIWIRILWASPMVTTFLFFGVGLGICTVSLIIPKLPIILISVSVFAFLGLSDWLALMVGEQLHIAARIVLAAGLAVTCARWIRNHASSALAFFQVSLPRIAAATALLVIGIQSGLWLNEKILIANLPEASKEAPNILLIVIDTLRADHLSAYGYQRNTSPNLDRIAREGVLFESAISASSYTAPSHASLFTGRYPFEHRVRWINEREPHLDDGYLTLAETLQSRGYRTSAFSANIHYVTREQGFGQGFTRFEDFFHSSVDLVLRTLYGREFKRLILEGFAGMDDPGRKLASDVNQDFLQWLGRTEDQPFFAFLNYYDVHDPYLPPQPYRSRFSDIKDPGGRLNGPLYQVDPARRAEILRTELDAYDGSIAYVDEYIGRLLAEIEVRGLADNTLVVITSDHGEAFGEHKMWGHGMSLYREEIHVPLIVWSPGEVPNGLRVSQPVSNTALASTVMDFLGENKPSEFAVPSLVPLWQSESDPPNRPLPMAELEHIPWLTERGHSREGPMISLLGPEWHYIEHKKLGPELYDWSNDPDESLNLAKESENENVLRRFRSLRERFFTKSP